MKCHYRKRINVIKGKEVRASKRADVLHPGKQGSKQTHRQIRHAMFSQKTDTSNRDIVRGAFVGLASAFIVNLRRGDVAVAEKLLHLANILASFEQGGGGGGPQ